MDARLLRELQSAGYENIRALGQGSSGFVQLARNGAGKLVAVKFIKRGDVNTSVETQLVNHSLLLHPHVIELYRVFLTSQYLCIAMEYASGGALPNQVQKWGGCKEDEARWLFQQLIIGLDYCHKCGVAGLSIRPENVMLDSSRRPLVTLAPCAEAKVSHSV